MSTAADTPTVITAVSLLPELDNLALLTDQEILALLDRADAMAAAVAAARAKVIAESEQREAAERTHLCSTATFLTRHHRHSSREARRIVKQATTLFGRFSLIAEAACAGLLSDSQIRGILTGLQNLPETLSAAESDRAQELMVGFAADFAPDDLRKLSLHVRQTIDPDGTDAQEAARLEAERLHAEKNRRLSLAPDHHGSYILTGKLPLADGEELAALLKAHESALWRAATETDAVPPTRAQMRADALMILIRRAAKVGDAPKNGGDRPRISVLVDFETLRTGLGTAQVSCGEHLSTTELRRLACDADILPIVMNGKGVPMELGTPQRLVTPEIRAALVARDLGCVCSPAAPIRPRTARPTTSNRGGRTARRNCGTWYCCAHTTTARSNPPATDPGMPTTPTAGPSASTKTASPSSSRPRSSTATARHASMPASDSPDLVDDPADAETRRKFPSTRPALLRKLRMPA
ncbi:DUF222 domain-containing protein [Naumannella sp. ID2617S]|nr:DUF222 domain-containing protein [Naumannella sp. ID2617S]